MEGREGVLVGREWRDGRGGLVGREWSDGRKLGEHPVKNTPLKGINRMT